MKKTTFHKFRSEIYPIAIFVAITDDYEAINERFCDLSGESLKPQSFCDAWVQPVISKEDSERVILVCFVDKKGTTSSIIAHEALHVADIMGNWLGLDWLNNGCNEAYAYLMQWVVKCCNIVIKGKED